MKRICLILFALLSLFKINAQAKDVPNIADLSLKLFSVQGDAKRAIIDQLVATKDQSLIPTLVLAMRWTGNNIYVAEALSSLTGETISTWHEAYQWQEKNPEIKPHVTFAPLRMKFWQNTDKQFLEFFEPPFDEPENMRIRLEEITWGGVLVDGIPSLDKPKMVHSDAAHYLADGDLVFGVLINGDARAYPLRIMGWHEMLNDVIGGVSVALSYCPLCGSGILYETKIEGRGQPFIFGSSGLLYRSNKLMFDRRTKSLWNQFSGEPVIGPLTKSGIQLKVRAMTIASWKEWKSIHPDGQVLSLNTGYQRNYASGFIYRDYLESPDLMFPAVIGDESNLKRKDFVFGIRDTGVAKAWPIKVFRKKRIINDNLGPSDIVLLGDAKMRTVRAYQRKPNEIFRFSESGELITTPNEHWRITEDFLISQDGKETRFRIPGHVSYWFAWDNFLNVKSELYSEK